MKNNRICGKAALVMLGTAATLMAGCVTYVEPATPPQPVVVTPPPPPSAPEPAPFYVEQPAQPDVVVIQSESDFYEPLNPHGRWVIVEGYGRCWTPTRVESDWHPYSAGHWQRTDAGWYWVSDEQWGWATYHYGRWRLDPAYGWVWVPQTTWAPAWVCWREGGGYTGWAPLPPEARMDGRGELDFRVEAVEPRAFVFVQEKRLMEPHRPQTVIVNNTTIINQTVNITKIQVVNKTVINEGPRVENVEHASGRKVEVIPARQVRANIETKAAATQHIHLPVAAERKLQPQPQPHPPVRPENRVPDHAVQTPNPPHPAPVAPPVPQHEVVRNHETTQPPEVKKPVVNPEHRTVPKLTEEVRKPQPQPVHPRPESVEATRPTTHSETRHEPGNENPHDPNLRKQEQQRGQQTLTPQQKQALEKQRQAAEKKRLEEEKAAKQPPQ